MPAAKRKTIDETMLNKKAYVTPKLEAQIQAILAITPPVPEPPAIKRLDAITNKEVVIPFLETYIGLRPKLISLVIRKFGISKDSANEIIASVMEKTFRKFSNLQEEGFLEAYLVLTVFNTARNYIRDNVNERTTSLEEMLEHFESSRSARDFDFPEEYYEMLNPQNASPDLEVNTDKKLLVDLVLLAMDKLKLSERDKQIISWCWMGGWEVNKVAEEFGMTVKEVNKVLNDNRTSIITQLMSEHGPRVMAEYKEVLTELPKGN